MQQVIGGIQSNTARNEIGLSTFHKKLLFARGNLVIRINKKQKIRTIRKTKKPILKVLIDNKLECIIRSALSNCTLRGC